MLIEICKEIQFNEFELIFFKQMLEQVGWYPMVLMRHQQHFKDFTRLTYINKEGPEYKIYLSSLMHLLFMAYAVKVSLLSGMVILICVVKDE